MSSAGCARTIVKSAAERKRDVVMSFEGKSGLWLRMIAPKLVDRILIRKSNQD